MKVLTIITYVGAAGLATAFGVTMAKTNPSQSEYEGYAVKRLTQYLKKDVCKQTTTTFIEKLLHTKCDKWVDSANPQIQQALSATTQRQDFILFSVYYTDLKVVSWIPAYKFETVGAFNNFYTYKAEEQ